MNLSPLAALALAVLAACGPGGMETVARLDQEVPEGAPPGTCWGKEITPAVIETVTRHVEAVPAQLNPDGSTAAPPVYRTETVQEIVSPRAERWFETPCPDRMTPDFVASLQRALAARKLYSGPVSGQVDPATRAAVRAYQTPLGVASGTLSLKAALKLGLVAAPRPT